ncbi:MAG: OmpA family protein [Winogradskyella sp.]|nr:MAG: OmpA family protein [Winogradskyella sp.]
MGDIYKLILAIVLLTSLNKTHAQDQNNPWALSLGINAVDYYPVGQPDPQGDLFDEFFNANDHWNIFPFFSRIELSRHWTGGLSFSAIGSFNKINKFGSNVNYSTGVETTNEVDDLTYYSIDGAINYSLMDLFNSNKIDPYLSGGGGYTWLNKIGSGTLNASLGVKYWFSERFAFNLQSTYKHVFEVYGFRHFQHSASITYKYGGVSDTDRDGIYDDKDTCPEEPGLAIYNGCPDSDNDGIEDSLDECPGIAGLAEFNGCPDSDNDGVPDKDDKCPSVAGLKSLTGCPDTDGDGLTDKQDKCPSTAGPLANVGCPWPDRDSDGVFDKDDRCPDEKGTVENNGCPKITEQDEELLNKYARTILFSPGRSEVREESKKILSDIIKILRSNPKAKFTIDGHTDSIGSDLLNLRLSQERADSVKEYLVANGINESRLVSRGFGEEKPIATNFYKDGRRQNRRVEINLSN